MLLTTQINLIILNCVEIYQICLFTAKDDKKLKDPEKKRRQIKKKNLSLSMEEGGDEDCAALKCIKPSGKFTYSSQSYILKEYSTQTLNSHRKVMEVVCFPNQAQHQQNGWRGRWR